jgi:hypothetical protein
MQRPRLRPVCLCAVVAAASWGVGRWLFHPEPPPPPIPVVAEDGEESEAKMSPARYRYLHSQTKHWRAIMLKR